MHPPDSPDTPRAELERRFGAEAFFTEQSRDGIATFWVDRANIREVLGHLKTGVPQPYSVLFDLTAIDERERLHRQGLPASDFTMVYHLLSLDRNEFVRAKVALQGDQLEVPSLTPLWKCANWYEREVWDMFGIRAEGHPHLVRILMPRSWQGHPLRKDHPSRATEMGVFSLSDDKQEHEQEQLRFRPEEWGMARGAAGTDYLFLNIGPQHPGTHGVLRIILQLDGERIVDAVPDIGYHHRGKEKMGERQSWHTYIPYTDRVDYLSGVLNNLAYLTAVERLGAIDVPPRARCIRVMLCELFRISNHLVWYGTFAQDVGQMSPVFYMFNDRERLLSIIESVCGARMHPNWFRIGGVAQDLPRGWQELVAGFLELMPARLVEYEREVLQNRIFQARTRGVGALTAAQALDWGVTGPNLRACGIDWDLRKKQPYSGYDEYEFDIPTASRGDCYDRALVRVEEIRQSLRIIAQCLERMPGGPYTSADGRATPPRKERTMQDIETLIHHFVHVSWGPVMPPGETLGVIEGSKGNYGYYLVSDGSTQAYRTRIRTASFPHMQALPLMTRGLTIADLLAILGSMDYVLSDVDR